MRKIKCIADTIFWYSLYSLPIILLILSYFRGTDYSLSAIFSNVGLDIISTNPIYDVLVQMFYTDGFLPVFSNTVIIEYFSYFIMLVIIHVFVDVLLYIPRFCHKLIEKGDYSNEKY